MAWSAVTQKDEEKKTVRNKIVELHPSDKALSSEAAGKENQEKESAEKMNKDLQSGMELLELDFLLSIIENTEGNDHNDVAMRRLNFNDVVRRGKQDQIDSNSLAVYAVNAGNLYGKDIQCEATKQLAKRTTK